MSNLMNLLFKTNAFRICKENQPFWYTSGKIGPYFVNADYLYGSEEDSKELLHFIDSELENSKKDEIPEHIFQVVLDHYKTNEIYKTVIDTMKDYIENELNPFDIDYISGGERRDWYFSILLAYLLNKPHITIYKDLTTVESDCDFTISNEVTELPGKNVLHIADLLNQSASFVRAWVPAIKNLGSTIKWSLFAVDRKQGGTETLEEIGVEVHSLLEIDTKLFITARDLGIINDAQLNMLKEFKEDPDGTMRHFLIAHPDFLENALKSPSEKTRKRANLMIEKDIYRLNG